jgi:hypothetical protein
VPERLGFDKRKALAIVEKVDLLPVDALVGKKKGSYKSVASCVCLFL